MNHAVAITGIGSVSCNGIGTKALFDSAVTNTSGIREGVGAVSDDIKSALLARWPEANASTSALLYAYSAIKEATEHAGWSTFQEDDGLILATTAGEVVLWEDNTIEFLRGELSPVDFSKSFRNLSLGAALEHLSSLLDFRGPTMLVASACSAATQAIALGAAWVRSGKVRRCIVGGTEVLSQLTVEGFRSLQLLSPSIATPFDAQRSGINLSEAAAFLCLEQKSSRALAYVSGFGFSTDAYHLTAPHPEGEGCMRAMQAALESAKLTPKDITWVHAHGTGSKANDIAEGAAISNLFGSHGPWVSSTKHIHGHPLGASGALETVLCVECLGHNIVLKTAGLTHPDPNIRIHHPRDHQKQPIAHILKNTLGFGGNNASLVLSRRSAKEGSS